MDGEWGSWLISRGAIALPSDQGEMIKDGK